MHRLLSAIDQERPDVINLHNLHGFLDSPMPLLPACRKRPVVWTLHDMWSFTGRCAYAYGCQEFTTGCDAACPTPNEYPALPPRRIRHEWTARQRFLEVLPNATAVCPSRWLADQARRGLWRGHRVRVIPYGLDLSIFRPAAREEARRSLGLPDRGPVLAFGAQNLQDKRKGGALLRTALAGIDATVTLATFGRTPVEHPAPGHRWKHLGKIRGEEGVATVYNAADVFVHPSLADNLPLVLLEAVACGTPCVGMPEGGVPEVVREGETGWLAEAATAEAFRAALTRAIDGIRSGTPLRERCRKVAEREYSLALQATRYLALFDELVHERDLPHSGGAR